MSRLAARRAVMQMAYEQLLGGEGGEQTLHNLVSFSSDDLDDMQYINTLLNGIAREGSLLDQEIAARSTNRALERIPLVVRAILRVALYELQFLQDIPPSVVAEEAVELSKRFGEEGDSRFVNGLLGSYIRDHQGS
jgi:N utilization substance protein B